jgi:hypothetical protein
MISEIVFAARDGVAVMLTVMALSKAVAPQEVLRRAWRPRWMPPWIAFIAVVALATVEIILALAILLVPAAGWVISLSVLGFFVPVTIYGVISIARAGSCGCSGVTSGMVRGGSLVGRNTMLCCIVILTILFGPSLTTLEANPGPFGVTASLVPVFAFAGVASLRVIQRRTIRRRSMARSLILRDGRKSVTNYEVA